MTEEFLKIEVGSSTQEPIPEYPLPWNRGLVPWGDSGEGKLLILVASSAYVHIIQHGKSNVQQEVTGILVGNVYFCPQSEKNYVTVEAAIAAMSARGSNTQVVFDHDSWSEVLSQKERNYSRQRIVGWYHTHPGFGSFFSQDDFFWHKQAFPNFWQIGLVYDPIKNHSSIWGWSGEQIELISGFFELLGQGQKSSLIAKAGSSWEFLKRKERPPLSRDNKQAIPAGISNTGQHQEPPEYKESNAVTEHEAVLGGKEIEPSSPYGLTEKTRVRDRRFLTVIIVGAVIILQVLADVIIFLLVPDFETFIRNIISSIGIN